MRGRTAINVLSGACLGALNDPRNAKKGDWREMTWIELRDKLREEVAELEAELWLASQGNVEGLRGILAESPDVASVAAFCLDKALEILAKEHL